MGGPALNEFDFYDKSLGKYFDKSYDGSQTAKRLREAPGTIRIIIISGSEDVLAEEGTSCEYRNPAKDNDGPVWNKDRFDARNGNFEIREIKIPHVLHFLRSDLGKMEKFLKNLVEDKPAFVFPVIYLNVGESSLSGTLPTLALTRFLDGIIRIFEGSLVGYEVNTVRNPRLENTRGRLNKIEHTSQA